MSIRKPLLGFSLFAVIALLLTYTIWSTLMRTGPRHTNDYTAVFSDSSGLAGGDDVRMAGVRVGRVESIKLENGKARVDFTVDSNQHVLAATKAAIRYQNLIGQRYIQLSLVDGQPHTPLAAGARLQQPSEDSFDVTRLLAGFQPLFETLTADQVNGLSQGIIAVLQGDNVSLTNTVAQISTLANDMADRDQVIGSIVAHLSGVMSDLSRQGTQMSDLVKGAGELVASLNSNSAAFGKVVDQVGRTAAGFGTILGQTQASLASAGRDAKLATGKLINIGGKLDRAAVELPVFLGHFPMVMGQGAYLNIYACDLDVAFGDVLLPPGLFNKVGGTAHSEACR
ncbi:MAG TPA: MlaD family protein [Gordonia sp. (in: high G+C Gram-positive bacteria)]|nr:MULTISPECIES: MlaD family protein [unclassified Gordonia (in: high G+C Gram-positive bacteria)]HNP58175.1 MlaD family protein [Gordonia sp. (in: high G+C Gram-positive bacteria)]HRC51762.1 MlaD family protein [Gordonia sp. (in: high G+C Gram-positive bacteria)]